MNQTNTSTLKEKPADGAFRTAAIAFVAAFLATVIWLFLSLQSGDWQLYVMSSLIGLFSVASAAAMAVTRRGNSEAGGWIIITGILILFPTGAFLTSGVAVVTGIVLVLIVNLIANQMLKRTSANRALIISIVFGILTAALEQSKSEYRLFVPELQSVLPAITGLVILLLAFFIVRQSWGAVTRSLRLKIAVWTGLILAGSTIILIGYSTITGRQSAIEGAEKEALAIAAEQAQAVRVETEIPLNTARAMAQSLRSLKDSSYEQSLTRDQVNGMLRQVLIENPGFLGTYTLWEPNAFDGLDADFKNAPAHDATGRFIPYWVRSDNGDIAVQALIDYETPGIGDWYILPRQTKTEVTIAPLIYPINGVDTVMASFVVPIVYNDKFYGIAGVDAPISFVQGIVDKIDLYNGNAQAILMTADGMLIGVRNRPDLANHPATEIFPNFADLQERIAAGESFFSLSADGNYLHVFAPVDLGFTGKHWSFALIIPMSEITAPATQSAVRQGGIGLGLVFFAIALLWVLSGQTVRPLAGLTLAAEELSKGNFTVKAKVESADETGLLANTFNLMSSQLQGFISTLEQRVADRTKNLVLAAEVGRTVSQVRALDVMLTDAAELIRKQFDLYYVQVYLVNPSQTYLDLQAGTGDVGKELLGRKHRLPLNTGSINGRAATDKRSVVISDTTASATFRPNVLLPDTRSEMAVPLLIGDRVVGVLDMQSTVAGSLSQDVIPAFEALAGQMAIAVQNANLLAEAEQARVEIETQARRQTRSNWNDYMDAIHMPEKTGFVFEQNTISPLTREEEPKENAMQAAIAITGEPLGNLVVEMEGQSPIARTDELLNTVARQVSQQIESLRLLENAERYRREAEEASRRITRKGWKTYTQEKSTENLSYLYDLKEVRPAEQASTENASVLPLKIRDEAIGELVIQGLDAGDAEALELASAVAERLSQHIEGLRLLQETEESRSEFQYSQERLSEALEIAKLGNWEYNVEKDLFTFNNNFYSIFHTTAKEVGGYYMSSGDYAARFVHPEDIPLVGGEIGKALNSTGRNYSASLEHRILFADGGIGYISVNVHVERDEAGKITRFYGANQDVTERHQTEEVLRAREAQLSAALAQTEKLSEVSLQFACATNLQELLVAANNALGIPVVNRALLGVFNYDDLNNLESINIVANWWSGSGHEPSEIGRQYTLENLNVLPILRSDVTIFFNDTFQDERINASTREMFIRQNIRSVAVLPLFLGAKQVGVLFLEAEEPHEFTADEIRLFTALAPQIATVLENRIQFERAQKKAEREGTLNLISQKIQSATTVEAVLQIAARELGHALGAPMTIAQLSMKDKN